VDDRWGSISPCLCSEFLWTGKTYVPDPTHAPLPAHVLHIPADINPLLPCTSIGEIGVIYLVRHKLFDVVLHIRLHFPPPNVN
jgi:hypothetical protein